MTGRGAKSFLSWAWALLFFFLLCPGRKVRGSPSNLDSAIPPSCKTPGKISAEISNVLQSLASHPGAEAYSALGNLYGRAGDFPCATAAFRAALALDPRSIPARYSLALALLDDHDAAGAVTELRAVLGQQPDSFLAHNALGLALQNLGKDDEANNEFNAALKINPRFAPGYYYLAELMISQGKSVAAIYYLKKGLAVPPSGDLTAQMKLALAVAYSKQGDYAAATPLLQELVQQRPGDAGLHNDLGTAYAHREDYPKAAEEFKKVLQLDAGRDAAWLLLAKALMDMSAVQETVPYAREYTRRKPQDPAGWEVLGRALKDAGPPGEAVDALRRCLSLDPSSYNAHYDLAVVLSRMGHGQEAIAELEEAKKLRPNGTEALYLLARLLAKQKLQARAAQEDLKAFQQVKLDADRNTQASVLINQGGGQLAHGHAKQAAESFREALKITPNDAKAHFSLAVALGQSGDQADERAELEKAVEIDPQFAQAHNELGVSDMGQGKNAEAEREFRAAIKNDPAYADAENNLGVLLGKAGRNAEAEDMFRRAATDNPQFAQAFLNWGLILANRGQFAQAIEKFEKAIRLKPDFADPQTALGMAQGKMGRGKEAVETFRKVVMLEPRSAFAHLNLGIALADQYDVHGAFREFSEAARLAPDSPVAYYNLGRIDYDMGRRDEARKEFDIACRLQPDYPAALYLLALLERQAGHIERSAALSEKLVELEPRDSDAQYLLGQDLLHLGKTSAAIGHWEAAVDANPENASALYNLARELQKSNRPEARTYLDRLSVFQKERQLTDRVRQLGNFALDAASARNWPLAIEDSREALKLCGDCAQSAQLHRNLGLIYCRKGDIENGKRELEAALKIKPDDANAKQALDMISALPASPSKAGN